MRALIVVQLDLVKSLQAEREPKLSPEEKMRRILEFHVQEAKTDDERDAANLELQRFLKATAGSKSRTRSSKMRQNS